VSGTLDGWHLRLAVADAIVEGVKKPFEPRRAVTEDEMVERLWRERPEHVRKVFREIVANRAGLDYYSYYRDCGATPAKGRRRRRRRRLRLTRNRWGLTLAQVASKFGLDRSTLVALMTHHGFLELVSYGRGQRRRLVTRMTFVQEFGHNVHPENRIGHLEGRGKAASFPVIYEECLGVLKDTLGYQRIAGHVSQLPSKRKRLAWLLDEHGYLPNVEIARMVGCSESGVEKARARAKVRSQVIHTSGCDRGFDRGAESTVASYTHNRVPGGCDRGFDRGAESTVASYTHIGQLTGRRITLPAWAANREAKGTTEVAEAA